MKKGPPTNEGSLHDACTWGTGIPAASASSKQDASASMGIDWMLGFPMMVATSGSLSSRRRASKSTFKRRAPAEVTRAFSMRASQSHSPDRNAASPFCVASRTLTRRAPRARRSRRSRAC
jgi:hypothetical protein